MPSNISSAAVILTADQKQLKEGLASGSSAIEKFVSQAQSALSSFSSSSGGKILGASLGVGLAKTLGGFFSMGLSQVSQFAGDMSGKIREAMSSIASDVRAGKAWNLTGEQFGLLREGFRTTNDELTAGLRHLSSTFAEAETGSHDAIAKFARLGITLQELRRLTPDQMLKRVAEALGNMSSPVERNAVGFALLGRHAQGLITAMAQGGSVFATNAARARDLGLVLSEVDNTKIVEANREWRNLDDTARGFTNQLSADMAPSSAEIAKNFREIVVSLKPMVRDLAKIASDTGAGLSRIMLQIADGRNIADNWMDRAVTNFFHSQNPMMFDNFETVQAARRAAQTRADRRTLHEQEQDRLRQEREARELARNDFMSTIGSGTQINPQAGGMVGQLTSSIAHTSLQTRPLGADSVPWIQPLRQFQTEMISGANMARAYDLALQGSRLGLSAAQTAQLNYGISLIRMSELYERNRQLTEQFRTPMEQLADRTRFILAAGTSTQTLGRGFLQALNQAEQGLNIRYGQGATDAHLQNTTGAWDAIFRHQDSLPTVQERLARIAAEQLEENKQTANYLGDIKQLLQLKPNGALPW